MKLTREWLQEEHACAEGIKYWEAIGSPDAGETMTRAAADGEYGYCRWLIAKCMDKPAAVDLAILSAEMALPIFEKKYPEDTRPRAAIEAAKAWRSDPSDENKAKARSDATAATAAADAADAADAARKETWTKMAAKFCELTK